jgi:hypothetical protein
MSQANLDHNLKFCFFEIYFNIITHPTPLAIKPYFHTMTAGIFSSLASFMRLFFMYGKKCYTRTFKVEILRAARKTISVLKYVVTLGAKNFLAYFFQHFILHKILCSFTTRAFTICLGYPGNYIYNTSFIDHSRES